MILLTSSKLVELESFATNRLFKIKLHFYASHLFSKPRISRDIDPRNLFFSQSFVLVLFPKFL